MQSRDHNMNLRVSEHELEMLRALAAHDGLTASDFLRQYIRRAFMEQFGTGLPAVTPAATTTNARKK